MILEKVTAEKLKDPKKLRAAVKVACGCLGNKDEAPFAKQEIEQIIKLTPHWPVGTATPLVNAIYCGLLECLESLTDKAAKRSVGELLGGPFADLVTGIIQNIWDPFKGVADPSAETEKFKKEYKKCN
jgi:hypothetical protein